MSIDELQHLGDFRDSMLFSFSTMKQMLQLVLITKHVASVIFIGRVAMATPLLQCRHRNNLLNISKNTLSDFKTPHMQKQIWFTGI